MAGTDLNKPYIYDLLGRLNVSFGRVIRNLAELESAGVFNPKIVRTISGLSKELQADANVHFLEALQDVEQRDWARFGKVRNARVKRPKKR
jgi:hypothetical protein